MPPLALSSYLCQLSRAAAHELRHIFFARLFKQDHLAEETSTCIKKPHERLLLAPFGVDPCTSARDLETFEAQGPWPSHQTPIKHSARPATRGAAPPWRLFKR